MYLAQELGDTRRLKRWWKRCAFTYLALRKSFGLQIGREFEAFRPTDLSYSTMKAGEMPQTRSRSTQNETTRTLQNQ